MHGAMCGVVYVYTVACTVHRATYGLKKHPTDKNIRKKRAFDNRKHVFLDLCRKTHGIQVAADGDTKITPIETHAETPTKEVVVEAAELSQLAIQDHTVISARVVGEALFNKFE
jgi:hypothetical protein